MDLDATMNAVSRDWELPLVNAAAGIDERWLQSFLALRIADLVAQVAVGDRLKHLGPIDRAWLKAQAELFVSDAVAHFDVLLLEAEGADADPRS